MYVFRLSSNTFDHGRRDLYDESGEVDDENDALQGKDLKDWEEYWRVLFPKVRVILSLLAHIALVQITSGRQSFITVRLQHFIVCLSKTLTPYLIN